MKRYKVIQKTGLPVSLTWLVYITLDLYDATGWVWGALGVWIALVWAAVITLRLHEDEVDISSLPLKKKEDDE